MAYECKTPFLHFSCSFQDLSLGMSQLVRPPDEAYSSSLEPFFFLNKHTILTPELNFLQETWPSFCYKSGF